jgi:hypothetical protein
MADRRDPDVFKILRGQVGQHFGIDVVIPKRVFVALQPQLPQPRRNVHGVPRKAIEIGTRHYQDDARRATDPLSGSSCSKAA